MPTYRITNITNTVGRRDTKYNSIANIEYIDKMQKKSIKVNPGEVSYLTISQLPISAKKLLMGKYIEIQEISDVELKNIMKPKIADSPILEPKEEPIIPIKKKIIKQENPSLD